MSNDTHTPAAVASRVSVSHHTGESYPVPERYSDREGIDDFLARNPSKEVVVVQGLGFVGAVMSLVCANADTEYAVIGVDLPNEGSLWKIEEINSGTFPIVSSDAKVAEFYAAARGRGNFYATGDPYAYAQADIIIVDINLDVAKDSGDDNELIGYDVDLGPFRRAIEAIARNCRPEVLVLVETTVPPGTCRQVVYPTLTAGLEARGLSTAGLAVGHSYERVMPGPNYIDSIKNFYRVFSGVDEASARRTEAFLRTIISTEEYPLTQLQRTEATEMAKVLENSYRAMNIGFVVEWSRFAEEAGVDFYEVVRAIRMRPTHANLMLPGIGVGGYCLTKDPLLASWARQHLLGGGTLAQSERAVRINDQMPRYAFERLLRVLGAKDLTGQRVLLLGVSYRSDVGDTRYTPVEPFYRFCRKAGAEVQTHDPYVGYWEELALDVPADVNKISGPFDVIVISTMHAQYTAAFVSQFVEAPRTKLVFDTVGRLSHEEIASLSAETQVSVLGRGDL